MEYIFYICFFTSVLYILYYIQHFTHIQTHLPQRYTVNANGYPWVLVKRRIGLYWARHVTELGPSNLSMILLVSTSYVGGTFFKISSPHRLSENYCFVLVRFYKIWACLPWTRPLSVDPTHILARRKLSLLRVRLKFVKTSTVEYTSC